MEHGEKKVVIDLVTTRIESGKLGGGQ